MNTQKARDTFPKGTRVRWSTYNGTMHWTGTSTGRIIPNANGDCLVKIESDYDNGRDPVNVHAESLIRESFMAAGFTPATRYNHYRSGDEMARERFLDRE